MVIILTALVLAGMISEALLLLVFHQSQNEEIFEFLVIKNSFTSSKKKRV
jgi:hypothetical protein